MPTYRVIVRHGVLKKYTQYLVSRIEYRESIKSRFVFLTIHEDGDYVQKTCVHQYDIVLIEKL